MSFLSDFKAFAMRGNVIDLAVAVVMGSAFGKIVSALVDGVIMPAIGLLLGGINVTDKQFVIGRAAIKWGLFLQSIIDFTIIAFAIFIAVRLINKIQHQTPQVKMTPEVKLLTEIRDLLKEKS